ncbi:MAG: DUF2298 domain-containing protein [Candidatus Roizmanbacteria bacterium]
MAWIFTSLNWYFWVFVIGLVFFPLTKKVFGRFSFDFGYPFAKVLAILFTSYAVYVFGTIKILAFNRMNLFLIIGIFALINFFILKKYKKPYVTRNALYVILIEEILFLVSLLFWTFVRSQEPSIRSLEKFMDFGFMNSILRSNYFPPKDIWYTPLPINYYYFGHLTGSVLIKLSNIIPAVGYNLILATIFALNVTQIFSIITNIIKIYSPKIKSLATIIFGIIGAYLINLGANLHTIYLFTKGYPNESPIPFWQILSKYNPTSYWYPNATRFIPFTIHEFPSYSYVVADLHGHVFDIPFVLLTLAILFLIFTSSQKLEVKSQNLKLKFKSFLKLISTNFNQFQLISTIFLGFLTAIHYMTNAFDGPIYLLLSIVIFFFLFKLSAQFFINVVVLIVSFIGFSLPFSLYFTPFITGIGVNCSPEFLTQMGKFGPFLFEKGNCQASPLWMLFILWGFFWISFILFLIVVRNKIKNNGTMKQLNLFLLILFSFGTFLVIIPEFFYIKDIYPAHFRANTMFKLGYQAFMMMGIASTMTFFLIKSMKRSIVTLGMTGVWIFFAFFVAVYPFFSVPSYYGLLDRQPVLDGSSWMEIDYPEDKEIIDYLNKNEKSQPVILEAQGDSYTDYERISAMTGLPTVAGWWVHEWLWRGSSDVVGERIPEVVALYQSKNLEETKNLIEKYKIKYIIVSRLEKEKYPELYEAKFNEIGRLIFKSSNDLGAIYQIN